jgi:serine/threonine protein kinase
LARARDGCASTTEAAPWRHDCSQSILPTEIVICDALARDIKMAESRQLWTTVGRVPAHVPYDRVWQFEQELKEQDVIRSLDGDDAWPSAHKPLFCGPDAKRFDTRLVKLADLGYGAFGSVEKVVHGTVHLARKRILRRRGFSIEDLRQEALTMRKLDHRHVVKLVATYSPRAHELCLLIWPAAVCNLSHLMEDIECLRQSEGDREDILDRLNALDIKDLSAIDVSPMPQYFDSAARCPLEFLRSVIGCISRALAYCHANDVRHLDIKPSNILLKADRVYLADFGISRDVSGQDHTVTEGAPGTERWRAPELYSDHGASMKLADIYSLGLVYLNVATVLYNARLSDFDEALSYSCRQSREEQLKCREEKLKSHFDKLTAHALVTPPFMFTYEGQETVRPRPLVNIITRMLAANPKNRPTVDKVDEKLSMLGGVHQIYHGHCCKRPISWVEDKWDKKFAALISLQMENELQRRRIEELEGKDQTYESRVESARRARDDEVNKLKSRLKEVEEKCMKLEEEKALRRSSRRTAGTSLPTASRPGPTPSSAAVGLGLAKPQSTPATPAARPRMQPLSKSAQRSTSDNSRQWPVHVATAPSPAQSPLSSLRQSTESPSQRSPSLTNLAGYALRSRGSGSKLPLPVTPSRGGTPPLARESSSTDSSMASSILSRLSLETMPTPAQNSPILTSASPCEKDCGSDQVDSQWGALPYSPTNPRGTRTSSTIVSSPRTRRSSFLATPDDATMTARPTVPPSFKSALSWAEVAMEQIPAGRHPHEKRASHAAKA